MPPAGIPNPPRSAPELRPGPGRRNQPRTGAAPLRRKRVPAPAPSFQWRTGLNYLLLFAAVVLVVDALIGDKGFMDTLRIRREWHELARSVDDLRAENTRLVEQVRRLKEDPATLEGIAREEHGMIRPGEILFILKDVKPASH